ERTLGLIWFPGTDELGFDVSLKKIPESVIQGKEIPTKRIMLQVVMSIFDVFGFLAPFTIQGRIMLQDTWRLHIGWDDIVPKDIYEKWCKWIDLLQVVDHIRIPRCYHRTACGSETEIGRAGPMAKPPPHPPYPLPVPGTLSDVRVRTTTAVISPPGYSYLQLHVYSDASSKAMSAVAYWRWIDMNVIHVAFIASKCRVVPVKPLTIPRAELQAALLAARLADTIMKEHKLPVERRVFWCDSTTVLQWIRNNTRTYKVFEANRLGEIDELTRMHEWRYVPTKLNVADLATREDFDHAVFESEWFSGPSFLYRDESSWPADICQPETNESNVENVMATNEVPVTSNLPVPDPLRFSSWLRLLRSTAVVLMFTDRCKGRTCALDCYTMQRAEHLLIRHAQAEIFAEEIDAVKKGKCLRKSSKLLTLSPFLDEHGVLRVGSRIDAVSNVSPEVKRPVILDGRNPIAHLIVRHYHVNAAHGNQETVVNELKQKYWLIRLRPTVKYVVSKCMLCKIRKATPRVPRMDLCLKKQWRKAQKLADMFWQRWLKEVLPQLLPRKKWNEEQKPLQVGDLVLVVDPDSPRNIWPKGLVQQVYKSKDGRIRQIDVKTRTGTWRRSAARVAPISLSDEC
ncbi:polyprotein, partial [Operophtera brumata]